MPYGEQGRISDRAVTKWGTARFSLRTEAFRLIDRHSRWVHRRHMRIIIGTNVLMVTLAVSFATASGGRPPFAREAPQPRCIPSDSADHGFAAHIKRLLVARAGEDAEERASWRLAPGSDTSLVRFESDPATCAKAALVHARALGRDTVDVTPVFVLRAGPDRLIVYNGARTGEFETFLVLDGFCRLLERIVA